MKGLTNMRSYRTIIVFVGLVVICFYVYGGVFGMGSLW